MLKKSNQGKKPCGCGKASKARTELPVTRPSCLECVEKHLGAFPNPEDLAFARPAATLNLYHVRFVPQAIWPDAGGDAIVVELYEPWIVPCPPDALDPGDKQATQTSEAA